MGEKIDIEWEDVEKKVEEDQFMTEKTETFKNEEKADNTQKTGENNQKQQQKTETLGLARMIYEYWNTEAVGKGYEEISQKQQDYLDKNTAALEDKYLKDINLAPEIRAGLSHVVVYVPKWLRHQKTKKEKK